MNSLKKYDIVCFGEVLWDILPAGPVPGGAAMNVAYHLSKMGLAAALITRIGTDAFGRQLVEELTDRNICTEFIQTDQLHETGKVYANPNAQNEIAYDIVAPVAWDFINADDVTEDIVKHSKRFVFGSLVARNQHSREVLFQLLKLAPFKVFDVNLRPPFYSRKLIHDLLGHTNLLKVNVDELMLITDSLPENCTVEDRMKFLAEVFGISEIILTQGAAGSMYYDGCFIYHHPGFQVELCDTIGCGDAFLAGFLSRQLQGGTPDDTLRFASGLGALVASKRGGCPYYCPRELITFV